MMTTPQHPKNGGGTLKREDIDPQYKWRLEDIYEDFDKWRADFKRLESLIEQMIALKGSLGRGSDALLKALRLNDEIDQLAYRVYYFAALKADEDVRRNEIDAMRQEVSLLFARSATATAWFNPELIALGKETVDQWMEENGDLALYRYSMRQLFRQQEHVLDEASETLLSYGSSFNGSPSEIYSMLSTADIRYPLLTLSTGEEVQLTYGRYYAILSKERNQEDRAKAFRGLYETFAANSNTYAAIYNAICQRDWARAQARKYASCLDAVLHADAIPATVVTNLIDTTRKGTAPLHRYYELRRRVLDLKEIHLYDGTLPLLEIDKHYEYEDAVSEVLNSVEPLGDSYHRRMKEAFSKRWIDVFENEGKRTGAYSAGVYGVHPYVLLNFNQTLDNVFTIAHEMGHTMHTVLANESQPFCYSDYTIFVAEVASTLNERLLLDHMLQHTEDSRERILLLQHAIDSIVGTFYSQVLFAAFELEAHRIVERGEPVTAEVLNALYSNLQSEWYGSGVTLDELYASTWARIPHLYRSPFYVYQYATCFASSAQIFARIQTEDPSKREQATARYLDLLRAGGSDDPMELLKRAGVDLSRAEPVQAVVDQLDELVNRLEGEFAQLPSS
jgi:oligoendopeptidase F